MSRVRFGRVAQDHVRAAVGAYEADHPGRGDRFEAELARLVSLLEVAPLSGKALPDGLRVAVVDRFPYSVVYAAGGDTVDVVAVIHQKRRPDFWRDEPDE